MTRAQADNPTAPCWWQRDVWLYFAAALVFFTLAFLIQHGPEAAASGSWQYTLRHNDEFGYWAFARGATESPASDGNPFYFEARGHTHTLPFTTALIVGFAAKILHVPVMAFFPVWHILMPCLLWITLFYAASRIWDYPKPQSAAAASLILLSTLFLTGQPQQILYRFSRPGDGLWLILLWIALIFQVKADETRRVVLMAVAAFLAFWLQPFYVVLGVLITGCEMLWQFFKERNPRLALTHLAVLFAVGMAAATFYAYVHAHMIENPWFFITNEKEAAAAQIAPLPLLLYLAVILLVWLGVRTTSRGFTKLDRALLFIFLIEPVTTHIQFILARNFQFASHRYYFLVIEMAVLTAWFAEKMPDWLARTGFRQKEKMLWAGLAMAVVALILNPHTNFFRYMPVPDSHYHIRDNALILLGLFPVIFLAVRAGYGLLTWPSPKWRRQIGWGFVLGLGLLGYAIQPSQIRDQNAAFPFDGAYQWLNQHAVPEEVVLTLAPSRRWMSDYLILHTRQKSYFDAFYGKTLPSREGEHAYRARLYAALMLGNLPVIPFEGLDSLEAKLKHLRLDYLLIPAASPFRKRVEGQLADYLEVVYEDKQCLLWRLKL